MAARSPEKDALRVVRFVGRARAQVRPASRPDMLLIENGDRGTICAAKALLLELAAAGLVERQGGDIRLTPTGLAFGAGGRSADVVPEGVGQLGFVALAGAEGGRSLVDLEESPLAQLARRRGRDGQPFLAAAEVRAGERLRADYTRGQIMPRLGANWIATVASGRRDGTGGIGELTDAALAARMRVEKAIDAVGPELSGVLVDVCCFLKGLERVEAERGWPARSAKVVLKTALGALSRHYEPPRRRPPQRVLHWGTEDFRPSVA